MNNADAKNPLPKISGFADFEARLAAAPEFRAAHGRPLVVLSYAQSLDGSIAGRRRERIRLSGPESMQLTISIRARCAAILVGIGTVLSDDPRLTLKQTPGRPPQPVVLDTHLRIPLDAALIRRKDLSPWLVHGPEAPHSRRETLNSAGATPYACRTGAQGWIDLESLMPSLAARGVDSLMVEGGARVIASFLRNRLADVVVITLSPQLLGGLPAIDAGSTEEFARIGLGEPVYETLGRDLIVWGHPEW